MCSRILFRIRIISYKSGSKFYYLNDLSHSQTHKHFSNMKFLISLIILTVLYEFVSSRAVRISFLQEPSRALRQKRQNLCPTNKTNQAIADEITAAVQADKTLSTGLRGQLLTMLSDLDSLLKNGFKSPGQQSRFISIIKSLMQSVPSIIPTICQICITNWGSVCSWIDYIETVSFRKNQIFGKITIIQKNLKYSSFGKIKNSNFRKLSDYISF